MRARAWLTFTVLTCSLLAGLSPAVSADAKRFHLTPFVGWTFFDNERRYATGEQLNNDFDFGGRAGIRLAGPLWFEVAAGITRTTDSLDTKESWKHISGNLMLATSSHTINPFISLGGGAARFKNGLGAEVNSGIAEAAGGFLVRFSDVVGLRLEGRSVLWVPKNNWTKAHINDNIVGAGLSFSFGGSDGDLDRDGVSDKNDKCPDTPVGCQVGADGCPIDADGDGVCDGVDQCAGTPSGASVDAKGCPADQDGDGVWNGIDQCADTPKVCSVDARGCPIDADGDGVCDGIDTCPNSPAGCKVDANGCPTDGDGDGVCDGLDKCLDTPRGAKVESDGCPPSEVRQREIELLDTGLIRLQDVKFETAKADILPESRHPLDVVGEVLSKWPQLKIEIGGHCDSRGSNAYNLGLSQRRVASVRAYLLEHFPKLQGTQLVAKGYGESQPLVPNTSPENMAQNRRVEFKVLNREVLKQVKP